MMRNSPKHLLGLAACLGAGVAAQAADPNAQMRFVELGVQRDANHNQLVLGTVALPVGQRPWLQLGGGETRVKQDAVEHKAGLFSAGAGYVGDGWLASIVGTHRGDSAAYRQTDWVAAVEWRSERVNIGLDGSYRNARQQGTVATSTSSGTALVPVEQRVKGGGVGLHGGVMLGTNARIYAASMHYDYRTHTRQNGEVGGSSSGGSLDGLLGNSSLLARALSSRASLVSRDEVALARSSQLGTSYRVTDKLLVSAEYLGDKVLDVPGNVHTVQLKASVELAPRWTATPSAGRTRSDEFGGVNFGALTVTRAW